MSRPSPPEIKALVFDVFGTLVDWRTGIAAAAERELSPPRPGFDPGAFADAWRGYYQPSMAPIRDGQRPWVNLDRLNAETLPRALADLGLDAPSDAVATRLVRAWWELDAWPDAAEALARLRSAFLLAPLSNGHFALSISLARRNNFYWDAILGAELVKTYKPVAETYCGGVAALGLTPPEVMMVACHSDDLAAARACGLRTAHIARPDEKGPGRGEAAPLEPFEFAFPDMTALADHLLDARAHGGDLRGAPIR